MKITKITQQAKRADRYSIFVDGRYAFSLSEGALLESKLASGQELSKEQLKEYKQASADDKLYNQALRYAAMRPRSTYEMEIYLQHKKCAPPLLSHILNKLSKIGLLDDEGFARSWIASRALLKPSSVRKLRLELRVKRVPDEIIQKVMSEEGPDESTALQEVIARKRKQTKYQDDQKLMQYLARQGFNYDDIKRALSEEL